MVSWSFTTPKDRNTNERIMVKYATGQPMGLYSSWAALAITNHILVRLAAYRLGFNKFSDYLVLGDDIVIFSPQVA